MRSITAEDVRQAQPGWYASGLSTECDDLLMREDATGEDAAEMARGSHYDYVAQTWREGHDHAHFGGNSPLVFCGADVATCCGVAS